MAEQPRMDPMNSLKKPMQWALLAGVLAAIYSLSWPNFYRSELRLLPVESRSSGGLGGLATAAAAFGVSLPGGEGSDANFVDILNSRSIREQILQTEYRYHVRTWRFGSEKLVTGTLFNHLKATNMDRGVVALGGVLSASRDLKSKVITLSAETISPELSQQIVQRAGKLLEAFIQQKGRTRGGAKAIFAEARLLDARREMDQAELSFRKFLEGNRNYQSSGDPAVRLQGARLDNELRLRQQLVMTLAMNREQALLEEKNDIPILNVLDPGNLPIEKSRPARAQMVIVVALLTGLGVWGVSNRHWIKRRLIDSHEEIPEDHA